MVQPSHFETSELRRNNTYGFKATFNEKAFGDFWKPFATVRTDITIAHRPRANPGTVFAIPSLSMASEFLFRRLRVNPRRATAP